MIMRFTKQDSMTLLHTALTAAAALILTLTLGFGSLQADAAETSDTGDSQAESMTSSVTFPAEPDCLITYVFDDGSTYTVDTLVAMSMMMTNEDGSWYIDPDTGYYVCDYNKMWGFFTCLNILYPSSETGTSEGFITTDGELLSEYDGSFQQTKRIDVDAEIAYLASAIMEQRTETHEAIYRYGGTYIEIDITSQVLYYYEDGVLAFTTNVVTGNLSSGSGTPTGVYYIRGKATDVNLVGADYVSHVDYWMNFIGNSYGIHDADWRVSFGGTIYLTNGSHGCVNVPPSVMGELYDMVEIGTPVILYEH